MTNTPELLPNTLADRYKAWNASEFQENKTLFERLVAEGQSPQAFVISCVDSRVDVASIFGAEPGMFFVHRNIANLVPPYVADGSAQATASALEYAITALSIPRIMIVGHSQCGGVAGCHAMCSGKAPELEAKTSFVGRWIDGLRPAFDRLKTPGDKPEALQEFEQQSVRLSLENLQTYPFVVSAMEGGKLTVHGLWMDIAAGQLWQFDQAQDSFVPV